MPTRRGSGSVKTTAQKNKVKKIVKKVAEFPTKIINRAGLPLALKMTGRKASNARKTVKKIQNPKKKTSAERLALLRSGKRAKK